MSARRPNNLVFALWANALLLAGILVALLARGGGTGLLPAAFAQAQPPIAGGAGVFVMPAQLSVNTWGCYLLDVDAQTLAVYYYHPSDRQLRFAAARNYTYDRRVKNFNTIPSPREVQEMVERDNRAARGDAPPATAPAPESPAPE